LGYGTSDARIIYLKLQLVAKRAAKKLHDYIVSSYMATKLATRREGIVGMLQSATGKISVSDDVWA
jgi:hypothetical protein